MMAGLVLMCGLITLEVLLDDTIQTEDDVAKHLGLSVLSSVPEREDEVKEDKEAMAKNKPAKNKLTKNRKRGRNA
jgi:hypothetical protein